MSQNLFLVFPPPVALALLALVLILLPVARVLIALHQPVPVRIPGQDQHQGAARAAHLPVRP